MRMKRLFALPLLIALAVPLVAQNRPRCGIPDRDQRPGAAFGAVPSDCGYFSTTIDAAYEPTFYFDVNVVFHVIQNTSGDGFLSAATLQDQIDVLNEDFQALPGSLGEMGRDAKIRFRLATEDPLGDPTTGITYSTNDNWFADNGQYWNSLAWDTNRYLNIYTNSAGGFFGYVPDWPQGGLVGQNRDRVVVWWQAVGKDPTPGWPENRGRTATHEVGHYFGIEHPFYGGCAPAGSCYTNGDLICDTNPQNIDSFGCPGAQSSCGSPDSFHNYMDYSDDPCLFEFTAEQVNRMRCTIEHWRPDLTSACVGATSSFRNGGANPASLTANAPVIGGTLTLEVDLTTSGHAQAVVIGFAGPLDLPLGGGQQLLVDVTHPDGELLGLSAVGGPTATWNLPVPPTVCGLELSVQALHFGGVTPFALGNARDLRVGS